MCFTKKLYIGAIFPVITNMFIVSWELGLAFDMWGGAYWYNVFTVGLGEAVVLYLLGIPTMLALRIVYKIEQWIKKYQFTAFQIVFSF